MPGRSGRLTLKHRTPAAMNKYRVQLADEIEYQNSLQYEFFHQWGELHAYAQRKRAFRSSGICRFSSLMTAPMSGQISACFPLIGMGKPKRLPVYRQDYFSATGQLWGNPHYRWDKMKADDYDWWRKRFKTLLALVDVVRIDHFRGFRSYWEIDSSAATAVEALG